MKHNTGSEDTGFWNVFKFKLLSNKNRLLYTQDEICEPEGHHEQNFKASTQKENEKRI